MLFQTDCSTVTEQQGFTDPCTLPEPLNIIKGQTKIFQLHFTGFCKPAAMDFVADAVFEDEVIADEGSRIQAHVINQSNTSSAAKNTPMASTTPATPTRICREHVTSTPITPLTTLTTQPAAADPHGQTAETKHHKQTSTKRQLFHTSSDCVAQEDARPLKKVKGPVDLLDENMNVGAQSTKKQ